METSKKAGRPNPHKQPFKREGESGFVTEYVHYRTGKLMRAKDYGYRAWPFGNRSER